MAGAKVGLLRGAEGDGGPGQSGFPASSNTMLQGLLVSHPGLASCCTPHEGMGGSPISTEVLRATTLP